MTVYRIQSKQDRTRGAYYAHQKKEQRAAIVCQMTSRHSNSPQHPSPCFDNGIKRGAKWREEYCGCPSAAALLRWFKGFIPDLLRAGYEIVALRNVTVTAVGKYQVLFKWND